VCAVEGVCWVEVGEIWPNFGTKRCGRSQGNMVGRRKKGKIVNAGNICEIGRSSILN